jgi:hypothetical protein
MNPETRPDHVPLRPLTHPGVAARFVLISRWRLRCTPHTAWKLLSDLERWPVWWPAISRITIRDEHAANEVKSRPSVSCLKGFGCGVLVDELRLRCESRPHDYYEIEYRLLDCFVTHGLWVIDYVPTATSFHANEVDVTYRCEVELNKAWMRMFAPVLRTVYAWHHLRVMRSCVAGMVKQLKCDSSDLVEWSINKR